MNVKIKNLAGSEAIEDILEKFPNFDQKISKKMELELKEMKIKYSTAPIYKDILSYLYNDFKSKNSTIEIGQNNNLKDNMISYHIKYII